MKSLLSHVALAPQFAALLKLATPAAFVAQRTAPPPTPTDDITNWEGGVIYRPAVIVRPRTVADEMRLLRSSYGLLGVLVEVTLRIKPTTAVYARHRTYTIDALRAAVPDLIAQGNALMMYFYLFCEKVMVEERRELPGVKPTSSGRWWLRNAFWRHLGPWFTIMIARGCRGSAAEHRLRSVYDHLTEFARARCARDPGNRLLSSYFATLLTSAEDADQTMLLA